MRCCEPGQSGLFTHKDNLMSPSGEKWFTSPRPSQGRLSAVNILRYRQVVTPYAAQRIEKNVASAFRCIFDSQMLQTVLMETNREGQRVRDASWYQLEKDELDAYIGLCIPRGVYRMKGESLRALWNPETGRKIFSMTMTLSCFE